MKKKSISLKRNQHLVLEELQWRVHPAIKMTLPIKLAEFRSGVKCLRDHRTWEEAAEGSQVSM